MEYTIPEILGKIGIKGYTPRLASAVNRLLSANDPVAYDQALEETTKEITGYDNVVLQKPEENAIRGYDLELFEAETPAYSPDTAFDGLPIYQALLLEQVEGTSGDLLLDSAIVNINRKRRVVVTELQGYDHSVKEFINNGDWSIEVTGVLANKGVGYPKSKVTEMNSFMQAKQAIPIIHEVLNKLGIYSIVVTDYSFPNTPFQNIQAYSFSALSDEATILTV